MLHCSFFFAALQENRFLHPKCPKRGSSPHFRPKKLQKTQFSCTATFWGQPNGGEALQHFGFLGFSCTATFGFLHLFRPLQQQKTALQELPALKTTIRGIGGKRIQSKSAYRRAVNAAVQGTRIGEAAAKIRRKRGNGNAVRVGAFHLGRALDNSLVLSGSGLVNWAKTGSCRPVGPTE
jgi:hypothetical protein